MPGQICIYFYIYYWHSWLENISEKVQVNDVDHFHVDFVLKSNKEAESSFNNNHDILIC